MRLGRDLCIIFLVGRPDYNSATICSGHCRVRRAGNSEAKAASFSWSSRALYPDTPPCPLQATYKYTGPARFREYVPRCHVLGAQKEQRAMIALREEYHSQHL